MPLKDPLPTTKERHTMHINGLIEEQAEMAEEVGYFKRLLKKYPFRPELGEDHIGNCIHNTLESLIELRQKEYWKVDNEIDSGTKKP